MMTVPESIHRNYGSSRSRRESGHINRHRSRKRRSILSRLRISYRRGGIRGLITDRGARIRGLITDRRGRIRRLIADRCHNGGNDRSHDRLRDEHFNLIVVVVSVVVVIVVMVVSMVVIVVFAYFDVYMATAKAKADDDAYRKPATGMWSFLIEHCNDGVKPDMKASFFCGDAAGRPKDHGNSDKGFAAAVNIKFYTEQEFFVQGEGPGKK